MLSSFRRLRSSDFQMERGSDNSQGSIRGHRTETIVWPYYRKTWKDYVDVFHEITQ